MKSKTVIGACPQDCPDTCSMLVKVENDRVVSVRGNPEQPFTAGRLCAKVNNYQDRVYSEDRVLHPLRRTGPKGSGKFERISWDQALEEITERWKQLIAEHGASCILPYSYLGTQGIINGLNVGDPFFNRLGATISERSFCDSGSSTAYEMTIGHTAGTDPESFTRSKYIILWACNPLSTNSHHWPFIDKARKSGAKLVVIDPYRSRTARLADWHLAIQPGTDGALALAMINVIINEGLIDRDYIDRYTLGFEELRERVQQYPPAKVAEITGIPCDDIVQLAREYASTSPAVIRIGVALERHAGGGQAVRSISCLPALIGAWRQPGGGLLQLSIWPFPVNWGHLMRPEFIGGSPCVRNVWQLGQTLTESRDNDAGNRTSIKSLFVYNSNPVIMVPEQERVIRGLEREDLFTVVSDHFVTDTAIYADIVLPATTQVEQEDIMFSWGHLYLSYNNRSIDPLGEAVSNTELFRRLAKSMNFEDPYFYRSDEQMILEAVDWDSPLLKHTSLEELKQEGFVRLGLPKPDEYAPHAQGNFPTPSGKCEFRSTIAEQGNFVIPLFRQGYAGQQLGDSVDPLPHYIEPVQSQQATPELFAKYPLKILSPKSHTFISSSFGNLTQQMRQAGEQHVILNPVDAQSRNIQEGEIVTVSSPVGSYQAISRISEDILPGVVVSPVGYWRFSSQFTSTVQAVNPSKFADLGAAPTFSDVLVQVEATNLE
ncbi:molybdopterin-dependent oxidoreductase [Pseudomaricurvus alkylphenolicus]|uniref:molybdopterin-containing oxidoreductase family protein n=1 Tax=Pseudomaricurvus alkylphenolicus TaxID=1306991 RepID=UPI001423C41E|nr:molybdopterin-dependent oxidoreductase [Pseudomaricurvus alkylphenolicus]NIB44310.1 molybdopterin-dependent oxidoreductase [Pseudomaricurvus alkylphenolicus]